MNETNIIRIVDGKTPINVTIKNNTTPITPKISNETSIRVGIVGTGPVGQKGEQGEPGLSAYELWLTQGNTGTIYDFFQTIGGDLSYHHQQTLASSQWMIPHPLNKFPSVSIVDTGGNLIVGEVSYPSKEYVIVTFSAEFSGDAYLN